jgi:hypothetical protein
MHLESSINWTRTPQIKADGNLKNKNELSLDTVICIYFTFILVKITKFNQMAGVLSLINQNLL